MTLPERAIRRPIATLMLLVSLAVWLTVRQEVDELLDETLQASAEVLGRLLSVGDAAVLARAGSALESQAQHDEHFAWQLIGAGGAVLLRSSRAPAQAWLPLPFCIPRSVNAPNPPPPSPR